MKNLDPMAEEVRWYKWRQRRDNDLQKEHGWLTLSSFTWIGSEPVTLADFPGTWVVEGESLTAQFVDDDAPIDVNTDEPSPGYHEWELGNEESQMNLSSGSRLAEVARRDGKYAVRVRDSQVPLRQLFNGVPAYDYSSGYILNGSVRLVKPSEIQRETFRDDVSAVATVVAELVLQPPRRVNTQPVRLLLEGDPHGDLVLNFHDATNGTTTADWRFVSFRSPFAGGAKDRGDTAQTELPVEIDFNYALNFPSEFTEYGTCPKPLPSNAIPWAIEAGEKKLEEGLSSNR